MWKALSGRVVSDLIMEIRALGREFDIQVHIGSDSKHRGLHTDFVTAIAIVAPRLGGRVFFRRERVSRSPSLQHRLFREIELSIAAAESLNGDLGVPVTVHVDANENPEHLSSKYVRALTGMVVGYGFRVQVKPDAWCATRVADYVVNERHTRVA